MATATCENFERPTKRFRSPDVERDHLADVQAKVADPQAGQSIESKANVRVYPPKPIGKDKTIYTLPAEGTLHNNKGKLARKKFPDKYNYAVERTSLVLPAGDEHVTEFEAALRRGFQEQHKSMLARGVPVKETFSLSITQPPKDNIPTLLLPVEVTRECELQEASGNRLVLEEALGREVTSYTLSVRSLYFNSKTGVVGANLVLESATVSGSQPVDVAKPVQYVKASELDFGKHFSLGENTIAQTGRFRISFASNIGNILLYFASEKPFNGVRVENGAFGYTAHLTCKLEEVLNLYAVSEKVRLHLLENLSQLQQDWKLDIKPYQLNEDFFLHIAKPPKDVPGKVAEYPNVKVQIRDLSKILDEAGQPVTAEQLQQGRYVYTEFKLRLLSLYVQNKSKIGFCTYLDTLRVCRER
jgi:hypothetical protein